MNELQLLATIHGASSELVRMRQALKLRDARIAELENSIISLHSYIHEKNFREPHNSRFLAPIIRKVNAMIKAIGREKG